MIKKSKFDADFVKQQLTTKVIGENMKVYDELIDRANVVELKSLNKIARRIDKMANSSMSESENQYKRYCSARNRLEKLENFQKKRRMKLKKWFDDYVSQLEREEIQRFYVKYGSDVNVKGLFDIVIDAYTDEELLSTQAEDASEDETEEIQEQGEEIIEEFTDDENDGENAEYGDEEDGEDETTAGTVLVVPEGQKKKEKEALQEEGTAKEKIQDYLQKKA